MPLGLQITGGQDGYVGTLTKLDIPITSGGTPLFVEENFNAVNGNGANCHMTYSATSS